MTMYVHILTSTGIMYCYGSVIMANYESYVNFGGEYCVADIFSLHYDKSSIYAT